MNKSDKIREYFRKHPDADVAKVAAKFEAPKPMTYKLRKQVADEGVGVGARVAAQLDAAKFTLTPEQVAQARKVEVVRTEANALEVQVAGSHYKDMAIQPVEFIHANGIGYFEGNVIKYISRWRSKGGVADLEKAKHYIDLLIELEKKS